MDEGAQQGNNLFSRQRRGRSVQRPGRYVCAAWLLSAPADLRRQARLARSGARRARRSDRPEP
jgi:hypothetical protein